MNPPGDVDLIVEARSTLLDALEALAEQRNALVLIGAQAVYLHTSGAAVALAEATKDSDLAVDPRMLADVPLLEEAMNRAGFHRDPQHPQPGGWLSRSGVPLDLMVPEALAGGSGRRSARIPPHSRHATRRTPGLEAAVVDYAPMTIGALDPSDQRTATVNVAGPAALLVAKLHKIGERQHQPDRLIDKDAHDIYRLLVAADTAVFVARLRYLLDDDLAREPTSEALGHFADLFAAGPDALGSVMAGRAEELVGAPATVSASVSVLARDVIDGLAGRSRRGDRD